MLVEEVDKRSMILWTRGEKWPTEPRHLSLWSAPPTEFANCSPNKA